MNRNIFTFTIEKSGKSLSELIDITAKGIRESFPSLLNEKRNDKLELIRFINKEGYLKLSYLFVPSKL